MLNQTEVPATEQPEKRMTPDELRAALERMGDEELSAVLHVVRQIGAARERRRRGTGAAVAKLPMSPLVEPDSLMNSALNINSALRTVEDFLTRQAARVKPDDHEGMAIWGNLLLVKAARDATSYIYETLDEMEAAEVLRIREAP